MMTLALAFALSIQDDCCPEKKQESKCVDPHALFCGNEKCADEKCKAACAKAGDLLRSVGLKIKDRAKKELGLDCCKDGKPDEKCMEFVKTVVAPQIKERMIARLKGSQKGFQHTVTEGDKSKEVACTFITGDGCEYCVKEIADASFAKLKEKKCCEQKQP